MTDGIRPSRRQVMAAIAGVLPGGYVFGVFPNPLTMTDNENIRRDPVRGRGTPISVERTIQDPQVDYQEEQDTVRYVEAYTGNGPTADEQEPVYETAPFTEWVTSKAASVGSGAVNDAIDTRANGSAGATAGMTHRDGKQVIIVDRNHQPNSQQDTDRPSFDELVDLTPKSATVTITLEGRTQTETFGVWVKESNEVPV